MKSLRGAHFLHLACQGGRRRAPLPPRQLRHCPQSKSAALPEPRVKAKSSFSGRNYFITMHHQAGVNFENFTEVKFRDILLTGMGHRDRRLNRDSTGMGHRDRRLNREVPSPGQTYGRSNLNQNLKPKSNFRFHS